MQWCERRARRSLKVNNAARRCSDNAKHVGTSYDNSPYFVLHMNAVNVVVVCSGIQNAGRVVVVNAGDNDMCAT